ncbi:MAG: DUF935 family protein [Paludibacteraceae bacterium]|nr:DUF935 family protein [Paludibacteraceae bacterium]
MRKDKKTSVQKEDKPSIIVQEIKLVSPDRNRKDVGNLKQAIERAESVELPNRYKLMDLYHDVVTIDGHLSGLLEKRTKAVTNKRLTFIDASGKKVDEMDKLIKSPKFERLLEIFMERLYFGCAAVEFIVGAKFDFNEIDRRHVRPETGEIAISQFDTKGVSVSELPMVMMLGEPYELGKLLQCSMYALYKRSGFGDFAQFVEIFGQPVRVVKYDAYDKKTQEDLRKVLDESGSSLVMMIPKQADFEMLDGKTSNGTGELQERLINCCNQEMSVAILGNSETTTSSKSSGYAQAEVHADQQMEITISDIRYVENLLNGDYMTTLLAGYGYPVNGGRFLFEVEKNLYELQARLNIDTQLANRIPIDDDYFYETYGIPKPDNYDQMKKEQEERRQAALEAIKGGNENTPQGKDPQKKKEAKESKLYQSLADFFGFAP